ncbi:MAG: sugar ABC transporter ATP-binding protein [Verrucomicrobia bacterium]|nr:sugar ABC transporter ATP-binding protein [Verrucomicrobiota bacterium]
MTASRLQVRGLTKAFGANTVLRGLDLDLAVGEIHALIGGNGAGKSTFSKILAGLLPRDGGEISLDAAGYAPRDRRAAQAAGVVMVLQELSVLPTLNVGENLFLHALPTRGAGIIDRTRLASQARAALDRVGLSGLDPETPAATLGVGHQQLVEIAAGLAQECRVLILDEPTAALTRAEIETLFGLLRSLRARGTSILYISHRLDEISELADRVSVLRDGQLIATLPARETSRDQLITLMAGEAGEKAKATQSAGKIGPVLLQVRDLQAGPAVRGVSLAVHAGEIVGLGGLVGAGRTELLRAIFGVDRATGGEVRFGPGLVPVAPGSPRAALAAGFAFVPEDRKQHGLFSPLSVQWNASCARWPQRRRWLGWLDRVAEAAEAGELLSRLQVRFSNLGQAVAELSGGNQQKVVIGRWLRREIRVWLLDEPTRGVDVSARRAIYALLRERAASGAGVLVASSDYDELAALCDRIVVLSQGRVAGEFTPATLNPAAFLAAAFHGFSGTATSRS